jgi:hypothetical protein
MTRDYIKLQISPAWEHVNATREYFVTVLSHTLADAAIASQIALAAHELIENAIKYSASDKGKIRVQVEERSRAVVVTVENDARRQDIANLLTEISAVAETKDPMAYYRSKIEHAVQRTDGRNCLGLARIRFESQMTIKWTISGTRVRISAIRNLDEATRDGRAFHKQRWLDG